VIYDKLNDELTSYQIHCFFHKCYWHEHIFEVFSFLSRILRFMDMIHSISPTGSKFSLHAHETDVPPCKHCRNEEGARWEPFPGRRITAEGAEKFRKCHKYFSAVNLPPKELSFEHWGRQTCVLPRAPSNLVTPLLVSH